MAILATDEIKARLAKLAGRARHRSPAQFKKYVLDELDRYGEIVKLSGADKVDCSDPNADGGSLAARRAHRQASRPSFARWNDAYA